MAVVDGPIDEQGLADYKNNECYSKATLPPLSTKWNRAHGILSGTKIHRYYKKRRVIFFRETKICISNQLIPCVTVFTEL